MDAPFIGYVTYFAFSFAPKGWVQCNGQLLNIRTNQALFALLGTMYGGDGVNTFGLPDLRGRSITGWGTYNGVTNTLGAKSGVESVTLTVANLPAHMHTTSVNIPVASSPATDPTPAGEYLAITNGNMYATTSTPNAKYGGTITVATSGSSQPLPILNPYLTLNACMCTSGIFPSRN